MKDPHRVIFQITDLDVQFVAERKLGRSLSEDELDLVKKGVEFGLECWEEVVGYAIADLPSVAPQR